MHVVGPRGSDLEVVIGGVRAQAICGVTDEEPLASMATLGPIDMDEQPLERWPLPPS